MASTYHADIQALYVAYFNRPADFLGLNFWETAVENAVAAAGSDAAAQAKAKAAVLAQISAGFAASEEYTDVYGDLAIDQVIGTVYQNLFGHAPDLAGLVFWVNAVQGGHMTVANAVTTIAAGAQGSDKEAVENKVAAAVAFTNEIDTGEEALAYNNEEALLAAKQFIASITTDASLATALVPATLKATVAAVVDAGTPPPVVTQHVLTAGVDTIPGTAGSDVITGVMDDVDGDATFTALDTIDGGTGNDVLNVQMISSSTIDGAISVSNVEAVNVRSAGDATVDTSSWTGVQTLSVTQAVAVDVIAGETTNVSVSGARGAIEIEGGNNVDVSDSTVDMAIAIGNATAVAAGNVTVTDTKVGAADVTVTGGADVTLNLTGANSGVNDITVEDATGDVKVTSTTASLAGEDQNMNDISVTGGSTITVAQVASSTKAATDSNASMAFMGDVVVVGDGTSAVTVTQSATISARAEREAITDVVETTTVTFDDISAGDTVTVGGLVFTAVADMTAEEVAAAFSKLIEGTLPVAGDTQGNGPASLGTYSGELVGWTSGAANGKSVTFTAVDPLTNEVDDLAISTDGDAEFVIKRVQGVDGQTARAGRLGVTQGLVTIDDDATDAAITTVTVNGYATGSSIGSNGSLSKLESLSLANSGPSAAAVAGAATMSVSAAGVAELDLSLDNVWGAVDLDGAADGALKTLNVNVSANGAGFAMTAESVEALTVAGSGSVDLRGSALTALETVVVSGAAGLKLNSEADTLTSVNTTATTGSVTATIDGAKATYTGGAGADTVTLATSAILTKAISLGAGNDTLTFGLTVTGASAAVSGGDGTDTLSMSAANADALDGSTQSFYTGFERLKLAVAGDADAATDTVTIDLANLGFTNYVSTTGTVADGANTDTLLLNKMVSGGTVVLTANGKVSVGVTDAATGTADVLNAVVTGSTAGVNAGTLTAADVETINVTTTDSQLDDNFDGLADAVESHTLTLTGDKAKTVDIGGNANLELIMTGSTKVTLIDGSDMTGTLKVTSLNTTSATTIKGGSNDDILTAATGSTADVLVGGAGNDTLNANSGMNKLTGGAGNDMFVIDNATTNVNSYATITDFSADDLIQFVGSTSFEAAQLDLGDTAVFQDYANTAIKNLALGEMAWFQFGGNTYIIMDGSGGDEFAAGDMIVKLTGAVDLSTASFNTEHGTIGWH